MDYIRLIFYDKVNERECNLIINSFDMAIFSNFDTNKYKFLSAFLIENCSMDITDFNKTDEKLETGEKK